MISSPLKGQYFQILLSLTEGPLHGYAVQRAVLDQTDEGMHLWPATLYRSLSALEEGGLIERVEAPDDEPDDERRLYYGLTPEGRERLRVDAELMAGWVSAVKGADL